jgi:class 3 adenylate cyclase
VPRKLPPGAVTLLFTDVEGSTQLLHELGAEAYADALAQHRRCIRDAVAAHGGVEVDTQGDAFFVAFASAAAAVTAARVAQEALAPDRIRVRMGLHTGSPHLTAEGYVGEDVHLGARIAAAGHGGQVLLSAATRCTRRRGDDRSRRAPSEGLRRVLRFRASDGFEGAPWSHAICWARGGSRRFVARISTRRTHSSLGSGGQGVMTIFPRA